MGGRSQVAVVVPTFNRRDLVVQAVRSVLAQTFTDLECLVVDNGSTDGTADALASLGDPRLKVLDNDRPIGGPAARNLGITAARDVPWVAFLDSDDLWAPAKLEQQLAALQAHPGARWSTTACVDVGPGLNVKHALRLTEEPSLPPEGALLSSDQVKGLLQEDNRVPAGNTTVMASQQLLESVGGFDTGLATCDDWDLWLRLAERSPLVYLDLPLAAYRIWDGQSSSNEKAFIRDAAVVRSRYFPGSGALPRHYMARWELEAARRHVAAGRRAAAARSYLRGAWLGHHPGQLAYAAAAVFAPSVAEKRLRRVDATKWLPQGWADQVEPWLSAFRAPTGHDPNATNPARAQ